MFVVCLGATSYSGSAPNVSTFCCGHESVVYLVIDDFVCLLMVHILFENVFFFSCYLLLMNLDSYCPFFDYIADEITTSFRKFGPLVVDWPHKAESKSYFPPKGYAFLLFQVRILYFIVIFIENMLILLCVRYGTVS